MKSNPSTVVAVCWALGAALIFTLVFASGKFVSAQANPMQVVFMRYAGAAVVISLVVLMFHGGFSKVRSTMPVLHVARAVSGVTGELCIIAAPLFIDYEDATAITLTNGVIAMILAVFLLKERAGPKHWCAAMICLAGAMLIARSEAGSAGDGSATLGVGIALFGAMLSGAELFFIKLLTDRERPIVIMLHVNIIAVFMLAAPTIWLWQPLGGASLLWLICIGPLALLGQLCWIRAFQNADAVVVVPVGYASVPIAAVLGFLAFGQSLGPVQALGGLLVVAGGVLLSRLPASQPARPQEAQ
ncbi:DMT family transporter [Hoeflea prorocentri]|uniref:DMT family transporter n=1 Tax=Hoeflea prorocentri TaxID=1922333 RepID=UPI00227B4757|nr:DMT family transporter [Hoeflea prorocentri]